MIQRIFSAKLDGQPIERKDSCSFCKSNHGALVGQVQFWDLADCNVVQCSQCLLTQLDPKMSSPVISTGCIALYRMQQHGETRKSRLRGYKRCFRKGVAFGLSLKIKGIHPKEILEIGAGDGYFCRGIQTVFPEVNVTCVDLVDEVLTHIREHHGFQTIHGETEKLTGILSEKFDLIVARDVLEHINEPDDAIKAIAKVLKPGGHFYFITPNGRQDMWKYFVRWVLRKSKSELLINHVNYFDGESLKQELQKNSLKPVTWMSYGFKGTKRGYGWKVSEKLLAPEATSRAADEIIKSTQRYDEQSGNIGAKEVVPGNLLAKLGCYAWALLKESKLVRVNGSRRIGHEIFGLFRKV